MTGFFRRSSVITLVGDYLTFFTTSKIALPFRTQPHNYYMLVDMYFHVFRDEKKEVDFKDL